jgi:hypothetical protein
MSVQVLLKEGSSISVLLRQELGELHPPVVAVLWARLLDHGQTQLQVSQEQVEGGGDQWSLQGFWRYAILCSGWIESVHCKLQ